jgi:hydrogenase maturation protease
MTGLPMPVLIVGIGNAGRGDDAAGLLAACRVRERAAGIPTVTIREHDGDGTALLDVWEGAPRVVVIDAVWTGDAPGAILRIDAGGGPLPAVLMHGSTHAIGLGHAVELARSLGRLPPQMIIYGIEAASFEAGSGITPAVADAVPTVVDHILRDIGLDERRSPEL